MDALMTTLVSGIVLGSLYALMASGLSLIWTTLGVFNFAHGALMMIGAFVAWTVSEGIGLGLFAGLIAGVGATVVLGVLIEYLLVRPFYGRPNMLLVTVMTTLAAMIILEKSAQIIWGARLKQLPRLVEGDVSVLGAVVSRHEALIVVIAPVILVALWAFATKTISGRSLRAVGQNQDAAALLGINVPLTFALAFGLGAALAGLTGILLGGIRFITPTLGAEPLVKAMIVVIFGGLGSLGATVGAAFVIGRPWSSPSHKAVTIDAAFQIGKEDVLGSIASGKHADFVVLDQNPLATPPHDLAEVKVLQTWLAGEKVYHAA